MLASFSRTKQKKIKELELERWKIDVIEVEKIERSDEINKQEIRRKKKDGNRKLAKTDNWIEIINNEGCEKTASNKREFYIEL